MEFQQVAPRRAETDDGAAVEFVDLHHVQLHTGNGTWIAEVLTRDEPEWFAVTVFRDSLLRAGGEPTEAHRAAALEAIVAGLRAMRIRVSVAESGEAEGLTDHDVLEAIDHLTGEPHEHRPH